jgi:hypothetical protein
MPEMDGTFVRFPFVSLAVPPMRYLGGFRFTYARGNHLKELMMRALIVDDSLSMRYVSSMMEDYGWETVTAEAVAEKIQLVGLAR